jgi:hypothetical protein
LGAPPPRDARRIAAARYQSAIRLSQKNYLVTPAKAGVQGSLSPTFLDSRCRGNDNSICRVNLPGQSGGTPR